MGVRSLLHPLIEDVAWIGPRPIEIGSKAYGSAHNYFALSNLHELLLILNILETFLHGLTKVVFFFSSKLAQVVIHLNVMFSQGLAFLPFHNP